MAYLDRPPLNQRLANLGTAGLIELGLIAALIAGLSISGDIVRPRPPVTATNIPLDPPTETPTPTPQASETPLDRPIPEPKPPLVDNTPAPEATPFPEATGNSHGSGTGTGPSAEPTTRPNPRFKPVAAKPANDSSRWVTTDDYPPRDLREGNQGVTGFVLTVDSKGRVADCRPTRSSGFVSLDRAACASVKRRARFNPATDETGTKVAGTYTGSVRWQIP